MWYYLSRWSCKMLLIKHNTLYHCMCIIAEFCYVDANICKVIAILIFGAKRNAEWDTNQCIVHVCILSVRLYFS